MHRGTPSSAGPAGSRRSLGSVPQQPSASALVRRVPVRWILHPSRRPRHRRTAMRRNHVLQPIQNRPRSPTPTSPRRPHHRQMRPALWQLRLGQPNDDDKTAPPRGLRQGADIRSSCHAGCRRTGGRTRYRTTTAVVTHRRKLRRCISSCAEVRSTTGRCHCYPMVKQSNPASTANWEIASVDLGYRVTAEQTGINSRPFSPGIG